MGSAYSAEERHVSQLLSCLGCSACLPHPREHLDSSHRPGPQDAPQHDRGKVQPVRRTQMNWSQSRATARRSLTPPPPRRVPSSDLLSLRCPSRAGFKRPLKSTSTRPTIDTLDNTQNGPNEASSPILRSSLEPIELRPPSPRSGRVSPMPDFASLPQDQLNGLTALPWLSVRSIAETLSPQRLSGFATFTREPQEPKIREAPKYSPQLFGEDPLAYRLAPEPRVKLSVSDSQITLPGPIFDVHDLLVPESWLLTVPTLQLRGRARTDPGQAAKRKRSMTPKREKLGIEDAVRELRTVVGQKRATMSNPLRRERSTRLARTPFPTHHVPAIAPTMVLHARTQLLSEIGSALSRPLSDELSDSHFWKSERISRTQIYTSARHNPQEASQTQPSLQARLSKWVAPARMVHAEIPRHSGTFYLCSPSADNSNEESPINQSFADIDRHQPATTARSLDKSLLPCTIPPTDTKKPPTLHSPLYIHHHHHQNQSIASSTFLNRLSTTSTASTISTSRFPTAPTTPPISRNASIHHVRTVTRSSSVRSVVPQLVSLQPALAPSRSSSATSLHLSKTVVVPERPLKPFEGSYGEVQRAEHTIPGVVVQTSRRDVAVGKAWVGDQIAEPEPEPEPEPPMPPDVPLRVRRRDLIMDLERRASARRAREMGQFSVVKRRGLRGAVGIGRGLS